MKSKAKQNLSLKPLVLFLILFSSIQFSVHSVNNPVSNLGPDGILDVQHDTLHLTNLNFVRDTIISTNNVLNIQGDITSAGDSTEVQIISGKEINLLPNTVIDGNITILIKTETITSLHDEENFSDSNIEIRPNPAANYITVVSKEAKGTINIYNSGGNLKKQFIINNFTSEYDIKDLSEGVYVVEVVNGGRASKKKILVQK